MKNFWKRLPFSYKLFVGIFAVIFLNISILLFYIWNYESKLILGKIESTLQKEIENKRMQIEKYFDFLLNEVDFLSKLEVMDDLAVLDTDRRITRLLEIKAKDLDNNISLTVVGADKIAYASSKREYIKKKFDFLSGAKDYFFFKDSLIIFKPIFASFEKNTFLGYLVLSYPLSNLKKFSGKNASFIVKIYPPKNIKKYLRGEVFEEIPKRFAKEYLIIKKPFLGIFKDWILVYAVLKKDVLSFLYHIQTVLITAFLGALFLMGILLLFATQKLTKPLKTLSDTMKNIVKTKNYNQTVIVEDSDEISKLSKSFNTLMLETKSLLMKLEKEQKEHFEALMMLIDFFIKITSAKNQEETIDISIKEIKKFSLAKRVFFKEDASCKISLKIGDKGIICIENPKNKWLNKKSFQTALSKMVSLQIEKIELLEKTKETLKAKNSFFSAMSHELKTPLGSILSLTQTMIEKEEDLEKTENFVKIEQAAYNLLTTINDILELAKAESGNITLNIQEFYVYDAIEEIYDLLVPLALEKDVKIDIRCDKKLLFKTDKKLFLHIFSNLLTNAIKFTNEGKISVSVKKRENILTLIVKDTGIGIGSEELKKIFDEFYQIKNESGLKNIQGSGLGLALSKKLAHILKGELFIKSKGEGKGSVAILTIKSF